MGTCVHGHMVLMVFFMFWSPLFPVYTIATTSKEEERQGNGQLATFRLLGVPEEEEEEEPQIYQFTLRPGGPAQHRCIVTVPARTLTMHSLSCRE